MANGDIHKLGTLHVNNTKIPFPTRPWRTDQTPTGTPGAGNILNYDSVNGNIEIRNTDSDDAYKLRWVEVNDGDKKLFISDRCLLAKVTWNELNAQGLVSGKEITISGKRCKIRLLSGGTDRRNSNNVYDGGYPTDNEWDRIIANESLFVGLPIPTSADLDTSSNATDFNSVHNQLWNWYFMYSWCKDVLTANSNSSVLRSYSSAKYFGYIDSVTIAHHLGWRPVLEVLSSAPAISIQDEDLGECKNPIIKNYTVSDEDSDTFTLTEKLDGVVFRTLTNQSSGTSYTLDLTSKWNDLSYGKHTIEIIADDGHPFGTSTVTLTFNKIKAPITPIPTTSSLKVAVAHNEEIKKEIEYQAYKLKSNLLDKGVEVLEEDKMSNLIDKIPGIKSVTGCKAGDSVVNFLDTTAYTITTYNETANDQLVSTSSPIDLDGSIRVSLQHKSQNGGTFHKIEVIRNGAVIYTQRKMSTTTSYTTYTYDVADVKKGDIVKFYGNKVYYNYSMWLLNCKVSYDYVIS